MRVVEFPTEDGGAVLVRLTDREVRAAGPVTRGMRPSEAVQQAERTFDSALGTVRAVARSVTAEMADFVHRPDELTLSFGLELSAQARAVITAVGASAQLSVTLTWRGGDDPAPARGAEPG